MAKRANVGEALASRYGNIPAVLGFQIAFRPFPFLACIRKGIFSVLRVPCCHVLACEV
jgi:hypothetical protein